MLVLSRKKDQILFIGDNVVLKIIDICRDKVRLGILAPNTTAVVREELLDVDERIRIHNNASMKDARP